MQPSCLPSSRPPTTTTEEAEAGEDTSYEPRSVGGEMKGNVGAWMVCEGGAVVGRVWCVSVTGTNTLACLWLYVMLGCGSMT